MTKVLLKNGTIVDGSGAKPYTGDLLMENGKILAVGPPVVVSDADEVIDLRGYAVAPGMIDIHTHTDLSLVVEKEQPWAICQGVTTQTTGLCGFAYMPLPKDKMIEAMRYSAGLNGYAPCYDDFDFSTFEGYMASVDGAATNVAVAAAHNGIRTAVSGFARSTDVDAMCDVLRSGLEAGCVGLSTGLAFAPCEYADYRELVAICKTLKEYDALFLSHIRYPVAGEPYSALAEFMDLAKATEARIHVLHYRTKVGIDVGHPEVLLNIFHDAHDQGADVTSETCPYISGTTCMPVILPGWAEEGGVEQIVLNLKDPMLRPRIIAEMQNVLHKTAIGNGQPPRFGHIKNHPEFSGMYIEDVRKARGQELNEMLLDLLVESDLDMNYVGNESGEDPETAQKLYDDIMTLLQDPLYLMGSDANPWGEYQHPRVRGCFVRMLRLAREYGIPLEKTVRKLTAEPAERLRLVDRGRLAPGMAADVIVFKPEEVTDRATFEDTSLLADCMKLVFVNGVKAVDEGKATGACAGHVLKRNTAL